MKHGANGTSSENEEEKHNELVCRPGTFRMITSSNAIGIKKIINYNINKNKIL